MSPDNIVFQYRVDFKAPDDLSNQTGKKFYLMNQHRENLPLFLFDGTVLAQLIDWGHSKIHRAPQSTLAVAACSTTGHTRPPACKNKGVNSSILQLTMVQLRNTF